MKRSRIMGAMAFREGVWSPVDLWIEDGRISGISPHDEHDNEAFESSAAAAQALFFDEDGTLVIPARGKHLFPAFCDVHVHFREPGQEYKETIATGSLAAAHGGFGTVCAMPNLQPVPDSAAHLELELERIRESAVIHVLPYGSITKGQEGRELAELEAMAPYVCAFSDDGRGVQDEAMMREAFRALKKLGKVLVAHAEIEGIGEGGQVHDGVYAELHGKKRNDPASESLAVRRDLKIAAEEQADYHVCHVSSEDSVRALREARQAGIRASYETAPHYLLLHDGWLREEGRFQMNPPIRSLRDQHALLEALMRQEILCIATDHAPHSEEEKSRGLGGSMNGIVGLETAFPLLYTWLVKNRLISLEELVEMMSFRPIRRFRLDEVLEPWENCGIPRALEVGEPADLCLFDLQESYEIRAEDFLSKGKASPFTGWTVQGRCYLTLISGKRAYADARLAGAEKIPFVREV